VSVFRQIMRKSATWEGRRSEDPPISRRSPI
jgi:hypothetical protein